jgi:hypothetical protein
MRLWRPGSSQLSCHNQTDPLPGPPNIATWIKASMAAFHSAVKFETGSVLINQDEQIRRSSVLSAAAYVGRRSAEPAMCEKCKELDQKIERYRVLSQSATDQPTIDRFKELIRDLYEQKIALHTTPAGPKK